MTNRVRENEEKAIHPPTSRNVTVLGGGLVGCLLSIYLARRGHRVQIVERRSDPRKLPWDAGRSINLALSDRGWHALEGVGLADPVRQSGIPMYGRMIHDLAGKLTFQPYGEASQAIYSVSRSKLNEVLMSLAEERENIRLHFNEKCTEVDLEHASVTLENLETGTYSILRGELVFGADGVFSSVRGAMQRTNRFDYSQQYLEHGYKELTIPAPAAGGWAMDRHALHIWPRGNFMLIALPNLDGSFTGTLFFPFEGDLSFESLKTPEQVTHFFDTTFPDILPIAPGIVREFFRHPTSSMVSVKCYPWTYKDKVALIGDAAHGVVPFYGQGMNAGFEDCVVLDRIAAQHGDDWGGIFGEYQRSRKPNADAIADLAVQNFVEMRDRVGDPKFLLRKKIEAHLHHQFPNRWTPLYTMVTFSLLPYADALRIGQRQDRIMDRIMQIEHIETRWPELDYAALLGEAETAGE
ncbi:MAG: FAD-dependent monooxygenase [Ferruginibacter sp.]|nr:FAD-dependent monooxygenase [Cytophagales bacterium]